MNPANNFDPNSYATNNNLYGLPFDVNSANIVFVPVPWEVTVSYKDGTANAPEAIKAASIQVDLFDPFLKDAYKIGLAMDEADSWIAKTSKKLRPKAIAHIEDLYEGKSVDKKRLEEINTACAGMVERVKEQCLRHLNSGKKVFLIGGDHSTPLGLIQALAMRHKSFAILQIDAHADLRIAYEDFTYSHASIMTNALKEKAVKKLVQVGIRDYCEQEYDYITHHSERVTTFFDRDLKQGQFKGEKWTSQVEKIIDQLPDKVYISFDIDGLDPKLCPNTGTPVPGGFEFEDVLFLIEAIVNSGKEIIGCDLNEVAPGEDEWDANVGARLAYRMANAMWKS